MNKNHAQEGQNKPSFKEVLEEVYGHPVSPEEAADAQIALIQFFGLLNAIDQEQDPKNKENPHD